MSNKQPYAPHLLAAILWRLFPNTLDAITDQAYEDGYSDCEFDSEQSFNDGFNIAKQLSEQPAGDENRFKFLERHLLSEGKQLSKDC